MADLMLAMPGYADDLRALAPLVRAPRGYGVLSGLV